MRLFCLIVFNLLNFLTQSTTTVVLEENGYTNILVAISDEIDQPDDGGFTILANLMVSNLNLFNLSFSQKSIDDFTYHKFS